MGLEELILHYYLKVFSVTIIVFLLLFLIYFSIIINKKIILDNNIFSIKKGENLESIFSNKIKNFTNLEFFLIKKYYQLNIFLLNRFIHYGDFYIDNNISLRNLLKIISKPSNILNKITIVEGWSQNDLNKELSRYFE